MHRMSSTRKFKGSLWAGLSALALLGVSPAVAQKAAPASVTSASDIVNQVNIPYQSFTLPNGLRVLVHEDRKAPIVAVSIWYGIGSKHEPKGKTGFAHLFEHLMFNGSENAPDDYFSYTEGLGATAQNGTTWFDRTNYFQNVPTGALDRMLFLEADRMGHLLGGVTQAKLDNQRAVVQNEKRQGDNQPYGLVEYEELASLLPPDHPYAHSTIGSMADLDSASLEDVKNWFRSNYGPNNAVLVLAGDIDVPTARRLVQKHFGKFKAGPAIKPVPTTVPTLPAPVAKVMKDKVAQTRIYREWTVPGTLDPNYEALDAASMVLGGLSSSRLDNALVRDGKLASSVSMSLQGHSQIGFLSIYADVLPGVDPDALAKRMDEVIADYLRTGPTQDELNRVKMVRAAAEIRGLEAVGGFGGKAVTLAEGALYANDPAFYKKRLQTLASLTPEQVRTIGAQWMGRPPLMLSVIPGEREGYVEAKKPAQAAAPAAPATAAEPAAKPAIAMPPLGKMADVTFPAIETTTLSNGAKLYFARRTAVPTVSVSLQFNAGYAADKAGKTGLMKLMTAVVGEGTTSLDSRQLAETKERLGAAIGVGSSRDRTYFSANALSANLDPTLDLLEDVVKNPAFAPAEIERLRNQQLAQIKSELTSPNALGSRALSRSLYGSNHAYGRPASGELADVQSITRDELQASYRQWIRPDNMDIFVTGDTSLAAIKSKLEARFGNWAAASGVAKGQKDVTAPAAAARRIVVVDRPGSPQSIIYGAQLLNTTSKADSTALEVANDVLGGGGTARLFMDLREAKGWSYGAYSNPQFNENSVAFIAFAPVQADKTGPSITAIHDNVAQFLTNKGITAEEFDRAINARILSLPGSMETGSAVLEQMVSDVMRARPSNYVATLPAKYRGMKVGDAQTAAQNLIDPDKFVWIVVGDSAAIMPQLKELGMPVETLRFDATANK